MRDPTLRIRAALGAQHHHRPAPEAPKAADHRRVVGEGAVTRERRKLGDQPGDIRPRVRPVRMPRHQGLLPRRELGVGVAELLGRFLGELADLRLDIDPARLLNVPQLVDLELEFGHGPLEVQKVTHGARLAPGSGSR